MIELHPKTEGLLRLFSGAKYGTEFTYEQILRETGCDLARGDRQRIYTVVRRLERNHLRTLLNLRGRGYKVARPNEHVESMRVRSGRARRQVALAKRTGDATPLELLTDPDRQALIDQQVFNSRVIQAFAWQSAWNSRQDDRIAAIEKELAELRHGSGPPHIEGEAVEEGSA